MTPSLAPPRQTQESPWVRRLLIALALGFMLLFLVMPLAAVFAEGLVINHSGDTRHA